MANMASVGHLYIQTNEIRNAIIHYHRSANGTLSEVERCATSGAGSGTFKPISGQDSAPNSFEGAGSVKAQSLLKIIEKGLAHRHRHAAIGHVVVLGDDGLLTFA